MAKLSTGHLQGRTVAVTGASGNVGTALLRRLVGSGAAEVRGLARRQPPGIAPYDQVRWHLADLGEADSEAALAEFLDGADAVVHLAWALQPGRHPEALRRVNVEGTRRVLRAAVAAGVQHVVHMSSLGAYAAGTPGFFTSAAVAWKNSRRGLTRLTRLSARRWCSALSMPTASSARAPTIPYARIAAPAPISATRVLIAAPAR